MAYSLIGDMHPDYIETAELVELCSKVSTDTIATPAIVATIAAVIEYADSKIDAYILHAYPGARAISPVPPILRAASIIIALKKLYGIRRRRGSDSFQADYLEAIADLADIRDGRLVLAEDSAGTVETATHAAFRTNILGINDDDNLDDNSPGVMTSTRLAILTGVPDRDAS